MIKSYLLLPIALLAVSLCAWGQLTYTPPTLSITDIAVSDTNATDATIIWTTSQSANSTVEYGETGAYGSTVSNLTETTSHSVLISDLTAGTDYHFRVSSTNAYGSSVSADQEFATLAADCVTLVASNTGAFNNTLGFNHVASQQYVWFWFTNTADVTLCKLELGIYRIGYPGGNVSIAIYTTDTSNTNLLVQVGGDSAVISADSLSEAAQTNTFTWSADYPVIGSSNHVAVIKSSVVGSPGNSLILLRHGDFLQNSLIVGTSALGQTLLSTRRPYFVLYSQ